MLEQHQSCRATLLQSLFLDRPALQVSFQKINQTSWHLQLKQEGLKLKAGQYYTVSFEAASQRNRSLGCGISMAGAPWSNLGFSQTVSLQPDWQTFTFGFAARSDEENAPNHFQHGNGRRPHFLISSQALPRVDVKGSQKTNPCKPRASACSAVRKVQHELPIACIFWPSGRRAILMT